MKKETVGWDLAVVALRMSGVGSVLSEYFASVLNPF